MSENKNNEDVFEKIGAKEAPSSKIMFLVGLDRAESQYFEKKLKYKVHKALLTLSINWDDVNSSRESKGLPKIKNETQRNAFIDLELEDEKTELLEYELRYTSLKRVYESVILKDEDI